VLVQGGEFLAASEPVLDLSIATLRPGPTGPTAPGEGVGAVEGVLAVDDPAADQQPVRAAAFGDRGVGGVEGPVIPAVAFGAGSGRQPLPGPGRQPPGQLSSRAPGPIGVRIMWLFGMART